MEDYDLFIGGEWVPAEGDDRSLVINPATEEPVGTVAQATAKDAVRAVDAARTAFDEGPWPRMTPKERAAVMVRMADAMQRRKAELVELNVAEAGSVRALADIMQVQLPIDHFRDMAERIVPGYQFSIPMMPTIGQGIGQGVVRREPAGVAALLTAFNFPFFLNVFKLSAALAAGCTTVLKPSPYTPLEAFVLGEIALEADLPPGVLNIVTGDTTTGTELTSHPGVDLVSFTGSDEVGRSVMAQAAGTLKRLVLELGGKSAVIVFADADLTRVIPDVLRGFIVHSGQACALRTRILVEASIHDELVTRLQQALAAVKVGDPTDPAVAMGPLISAAQRDRVEGFIRTGQEEGAELAYGGGRPPQCNRGFFVEPTLFTGVRNDMTIARREIFGPVGAVIPFATEDEAVRLANDSDYGLSGSVWSADPVRAYEVATRIRTGTVMVNGGGGGASPYGPFGGFKHSGIGREWGEFGLAEYLELKTITWGAGK